MKQYAIFSVLFTLFVTVIACGGTAPQSAPVVQEKVVQVVVTATPAEQHVAQPEIQEEPNQSQTAAEAPPPTATPDTSILFADDFEYGIKPDWQISLGEWRMVDSRLQATEFIDNHAQIVVGDTSWQNYILEVETGGLGSLSMIGGSAIGLEVRMQDQGTYMWFTLNEDEATCGKDINAESETISSKELDFDRDGPNRLMVKVEGRNYEYWVNNQKICVLQDSTFTQGYVGLWTGVRGTRKKPWFDNFKVTALP